MPSLALDPLLVRGRVAKMAGKGYLFTTKKLIDPEIGMHIFSSRGTSREHTHDFIEIVYVKRGTALEYVEDREYRLSRGDLLFINYGLTHRFEGGENFEYFNICFNPELLGSSIMTRENAFALLQLTAFEEIRQGGESGTVHFRGSERDQLERLLSSMLTEYTERRRGWLEILSSYATVLFMLVLRKTSSACDTPEEREVFDQLISYIDENPSADLSLSSLAKKCFYNPSYLSRAFKERFGISLSRYVTERKVERAIYLLENTDLTAEDIAEGAGFSSKSVLYRAVLRTRGTSLSDYRRRGS